MPRVDSEVYARMLIGKGHGYPLWVPEPYDDLPSEYTAQGVRIGDVGVTTSDGAFDFLFNICMPADHPIHSHVHLPECFQQIELGPVDKQAQRHLPGSDIASPSVRRQSFGEHVPLESDPSMPVGVARLEFTSSTSEGGILFLPDGASREDLRDLNALRDYGRKNAILWYQYVNGTLGRMVENGSIYLVTGCDKASSWAVASFSNDSESADDKVSLKFNATQVPESSASYNYSWETYSPSSVRIGPVRGNDEDIRQNQCVFIRGFKFTVRECPATILRSLRRPSVVVNSVLDRAAPLETGRFIPFVHGSRRALDTDEQSSDEIESSGELGDSDENSEVDVIVASITDVSQPYHPSAVINEYLLESMPEAKVALTHDNDWCALLHDNDVAFPEDTELLRRVQDNYTIELDAGSVYLVPKVDDGSTQIPGSISPG